MDRRLFKVKKKSWLGFFFGRIKLMSKKGLTFQRLLNTHLETLEPKKKFACFFVHIRFIITKDRKFPDSQERKMPVVPLVMVTRAR